MTSYPLHMQVATTDGQKYASSKINDIIISCTAPLIFGNAQSESATFSNGNIYISSDMLPAGDKNICFGGPGNPVYEVHAKSINTYTQVLHNNNCNLETYTPVKIVNDASNMQAVTQLVMTNGTNMGLRLSQNGPYNISSPNAVFFENANGDLHFGSTNIISLYKQGALSKAVCIGVSPNNIAQLSSNIDSNIDYKLLVNGYSWSFGWRTISDESLKENMRVIENACDKISTLSGYTYNLKSDPNIKTAGLMAQEVQKVLPDIVGVMFDGSYSLDYNGIIALLVEAVKDLNQRTK